MAAATALIFSGAAILLIQYLTSRVPSFNPNTRPTRRPASFSPLSSASNPLALATRSSVPPLEESPPFQPPLRPSIQEVPPHSPPICQTRALTAPSQARIQKYQKVYDELTAFAEETGGLLSRAYDQKESTKDTDDRVFWEREIIKYTQQHDFWLNEIELLQKAARAQNIMLKEKE